MIGNNMSRKDYRPNRPQVAPPREETSEPSRASRTRRRLNEPGNDMQRDFERDCRRAVISKAFKIAAMVAVLAAVLYTLLGCAGAPAVA